MSYPSELTFGVFDAAVRETLIPKPILWVWQVHAKAGKMFASLIDGGSVLSQTSSKTRYLFRSMAPRPDALQNETTLERGDLIELSDYTWRRVSGKSEIIFVIFKMNVVSKQHNDKINQIVREDLHPYPHNTAEELLSAADKTPLKNSSLSYHLDSFDSSSTLLTNPKQQSIYPSLDSQSVPLHNNASSESHELILESKEKRMAFDVNNKPSVKESNNFSISKGEYKPCGPISRRIDGPFIRIQDLTSFLGRWVIKGRFINIGEPRTYSNQRGEGKLWNCDLIDSLDENGIITCTFFNKAVDKFVPLIKENQIYTISRGLVKTANKKFNLGSHPFELQLGEDADIQWIAIDDPSIPTKPLPTITPISEIATLPKYTTISVCGLIIKIYDPSEIITRSTEQPRTKREFTLVDNTHMSIDVTFWGNKTRYLEGIDVTNPCVVLIENVRVDEYNGKKLSSVNQTLFQVNETSSWAQELKKWHQLNNQTSFTSLTTSSWMNDSRNSERLCIAELREQALKKAGVDLEDRGLWFTCCATLVSIDRDRQFYWTACPKCGKKVIPVTDEIQEYTKNDNGASYVCPGCNTQVENPVRKYLLNLVISDATGSLPCTAMGDRGTAVMGSVTPDSLIQLQINENDPQTRKRCEDFFYERLRKEYLFTIQAKSETYRDETRVRYRVFGVQPITAIKTDDVPNGPNGLETCRLNLIKEAKRSLNAIYSRVPRE